MAARPMPHAHPAPLTFDGGNALSDFRARALLPRLQAICPRITGVAARFVHWVALDADATPAQQDKLAALLTYGDPYTGPVEGECVVVMPRLGTVSPWASKATDIARNCGIELHRVERVTEFRLTLKSGLVGGLLGGAKPLSDDERAEVAALLHDRMTESVAFAREAAVHLFDPSRRRRWPTWTCSVPAVPRWWPPTANSASRCRTTRSTTSSTPSPGWAATPATSS